MEPLGIQTYGSGVLRRESERVEEFGRELEEFLLRMVETMLVEDGVGLAAPQVGVARSIAVVNPEPENEKTLIKMVNPKIVSYSDETESCEEGCLSVPGIRGSVIRPVAVEVEYLDENGSERRLQADGLLARIIQHEIDHLHGVLFVDRLSIARKMLIKSKLRSLIDGYGSKE
ncbi:MAG TPA: peptide deformylase [Candidatus Eisenbacteria bacterium]|uniref:Peptide deformylase n=1 Tax=Eiseniibacteriota bacterium TaxID=2212470 RepID=A0A7V2AV85_UNCEI|nr:peptide deformylase [Candidatus Eisenbacteria bacterium]